MDEWNEGMDDVSEDAMDVDADSDASDTVDDMPDSDIDEIEDSDVTTDVEEYERNGYQYERNADGQILYAGGDLRLEDGIRDTKAQREAGGEFRHEDDDGGHLIGTRFGGYGGEENLVAENYSFNRGAFKSMENEWADELEAGNDVHVDIEPVYHGKSKRPDIITGKTEYSDGNGTYEEYFSMTNENMESEEFALDEDTLDEFDEECAIPNAMDDISDEFAKELGETYKRDEVKKVYT